MLNGEEDEKSDTEMEEAEQENVEIPEPVSMVSNVKLTKT